MPSVGTYAIPLPIFFSIFAAHPFFVTVRLLKRRRELADVDFERLALAIRRARAVHPFFMTAWVFLPDSWRAICTPQDPLTISEVMKSIMNSSTTLINRARAAPGELW